VVESTTDAVGARPIAGNSKVFFARIVYIRPGDPTDPIEAATLLTHFAILA